MEKIFDYIIITVTNKTQKDILEQKIKMRINNLPKETKIKIIIENEKVGSGGALLQIINNMDIWNKKTLLINSAGESKRMFLYADKGKVIIPTFNTKDSIVFDEIINQTEEIGSKMNCGILVVSGDCSVKYCKINKEKIVNSTAFFVNVKSEVGRRHGVFVVENGLLKKALQKKSKQVLKQQKAIDIQGNVKIDTGIIYFNEKILKAMKNIEVNTNIILNLYTDIVYPLSNDADYNEYLQQKGEKYITTELKEKRQEIWEVLHNETLECEELQNGIFLHYGTIKEFIDNAFGKTKLKNIIIDSKIQGCLTNKCYIEKSIILPNYVIGENSIIIDSTIGCNVPANIIVKTIKEKNTYYTTVLDISQNNYNTYRANGNTKEEASSNAIKLYISKKYKKLRKEVKNK